MPLADEHSEHSSPDAVAGVEPHTPLLTSQKADVLLMRAIRYMVSVERFLAVLMLVTILLTMGVQVIARYVFKSPFSWSEEVSRLAMIWLTFIAASYVMAEGGHITVDLWSSRVSRTVRCWLDTFVSLVVAVACLLLVAGGMKFVWYVHPVGSPSLGIPKSFWYGAVSVGLSLMALHSLLNLVLLVRTGQSCVRPALPDDEGFHLEVKLDTEPERSP